MTMKTVWQKYTRSLFRSGRREIYRLTKPMNEMRLMECTEYEMSAQSAYDIDIEAGDIDVTDTVTVVWEIS